MLLFAIAGCSTTTRGYVKGNGGAGSGNGGSAGSGGDTSSSGAGGFGIGGSNVGGMGGAGSRHRGAILWARSTSSAALYGVAEGSSGVVVTASITSPADLGGGTLSPKSASDVAIAQYGIADGSYQASSRFGSDAPAGTGSLYGFLQMLDSGGAPLISGVSYCDTTAAVPCSQIDVGSGLVAPGGGPGADGFIGRYSVTTGTPSWVKRLVGPGEDKLAAVTSGPNDSIFAAAWYDADTTLSGGGDSVALTNRGDRDILLFETNSYTGALGSVVKTFATPAFEQPSALAWTGTNILMAGMINGTTQFGTKSITSVGFDFFVTELMADGTPVWAVPLGGAGDDKYPVMATDANGDVYLAGTVAGSATFGTYPVGGAGGNDIVVAKLSKTDGSVVWATSLGSAGDDGAAGITVNSAGEALVIGNVMGPIESGGTTFGDQDAVLAAFTSEGVRLWTKVIGSSGTDYGWSVGSGVDSFYALVDPGADIGSTIEGVPLLGPAKPAGVLLKLVP